MNNKKVCLFITQLEFGGAQKALTVLGKNLITNGFEVSFVCLYDKKDYVEEFKIRYDVSYNVLIRNRNNNKIGDLYDFFCGLIKLRKFIKENNINICLSFTHYANIMLPVSTMFMHNSPVVFTSQRANVKPLGKLFCYVDKLIQNSRLVNKMICVSENVRLSCIESEGIKESKLITINNGIDIEEIKLTKAELREEYGFNREDFIILTVGRFHEQKGHLYLLEASKKIALKGVENVKFILVGAGEKEKDIRSYIISNDLERYVEVWGERSDILNIMRAADVFLLPSLWEGMPNVVLEAMSQCLPVIATEVDGTKEIIRHGVNGFLIAPGDSEAILKAILVFIEKKNNLFLMGQNARDAINENFSLRATVNAYVKLFQGRSS